MKANYIRFLTWYAKKFEMKFTEQYKKSLVKEFLQQDTLSAIGKSCQTCSSFVAVASDNKEEIGNCSNKHVPFSECMSTRMHCEGIYYKPITN